MPNRVTGTPNVGDPRSFDHCIRGCKKIGCGPWVWILSTASDSDPDWGPEIYSPGLICRCTHVDLVYAVFRIDNTDQSNYYGYFALQFNDVPGLVGTLPTTTVEQILLLTNWDSSIVFETRSELHFPDPIEVRTVGDVPSSGFDPGPYTGDLNIEPVNWNYPAFDP